MLEIYIYMVKRRSAYNLSFYRENGIAFTGTKVEISGLIERYLKSRLESIRPIRKPQSPNILSLRKNHQRNHRCSEEVRDFLNCDPCISFKTPHL